MIVKILTEGANMKPGPAIAQKLGPLGINMGQVIQEINKATESFKGLKVPVELDIDTATKKFTVKVFSPPISELIKKELGLEKASGDHKKLKAGNMAIEQVISITKTKFPNMLSKTLKSAIKAAVGSCASLGLLIENKETKEIEREIEQGVYDKQISEEITTVSEEKLKSLKEYFNSLRTKQEAVLKKEEEEKAAAEATKAAEATAKPAAKAEAKPAAKPAKK